MMSVGSHSKSGREKEGNKERTGDPKRPWSDRKQMYIVKNEYVKYYTDLIYGMHYVICNGKWYLKRKKVKDLCVIAGK
jgi:hypothetical protein